MLAPMTDADALCAPKHHGNKSVPSVWRLDRLTPFRCRIILALLLLGGFAFHLYYLNHDCPITLSGDKAQYWDWSRRLDLSYYSKGPLIAYIIRASCAIFGDTMQAVRYPALVPGAGTLAITYTLTRKLFDSDRVALSAVLLSHMAPVRLSCATTTSKPPKPPSTRRANPSPTAPARTPWEDVSRNMNMRPDRRLDKSSSRIRHDAIYVGKGGGLPDEVQRAFDRVEPLSDVDIIVRGVVVHTFYTWRCFGFHGFDSLAIRHDSDAY
jgi:hypothetical protein